MLLPLWLRKDIKLRHVLLIPAAYLGMMVPAFWGGKSLHHALTVYMTQAGTYNFITVNGPSLYHFLPAGMDKEMLYTMFSGMALALGMAMLVAICLLLCLPNGIQAMSMDIPGLVQTSLNLGILACEEGQLSADFSVRSSLASQKQMMQERLRCLTEQIGGHVAIWGDYPAWEYLPQSPLRERMTQVYREQYGREPVIETIHAGVECGIFSEKLPGLDCVSFGPDLTDIHTPRERMHIASVQRTWALVREVLKRSK